MITAGDFRNGVTFEQDGQVLQIVEFQHVKPGKGSAFVRTKIRNVITGSVVERTYNPTDKFPTAFVERKEMQYLYDDGDLSIFMDLETYDQIPINARELSDSFKFVKENEVVKVLSALETGKTVLLVLPENNDVLYRSARNIAGVKVSTVNTLNVYDILNSDTMLVLKDSVAKIEEVYA